LISIAADKPTIPVQSIFFLLAALCFGGEFLAPFAKSSISVAGMFKDQLYNLYDHPALIGICGLGALLSLVTIFLYKNRPLQKKLGYLIITLAIILPIVAVLLYTNDSLALDQVDQVEITDSVGLYLPIGMILFTALAVRGVSKDSKLVESMDRLR